MNTHNIADPLANSKAPRLIAVSQARANALIEDAKQRAFAVWGLDGRKLNNDESIFEHFSQVMKFPDYFGHNWDAMDECLRELSWAPAKGHLLVINDIDALFLKSPDSYQSLLDSLRFSGKHWHEWRDQKIPFKVLLVTNSAEIAATADASDLA